MPVAPLRRLAGFLALLVSASPVFAQATLVANHDPDLSPHYFAEYDGRLFFSRVTGGHELGSGGSTRGLWAYDADADTSVFIAPFNEEPRYLTAYDGRLFFAADVESFVTELWAYDAAAGDVGVVAGSPLYPIGLTVYDGRLFFGGRDGVAGDELFAYDAATGASTLAADVRPGPDGSAPFFFTLLDGRLFFSADDGQAGRELFVYDAATGQATRVADVNPGPASSSPRNLVAYAGRLFFNADDGQTGRELWSYDPATGTASRVADVRPGAAGSEPGDFGFAVYDDRLFFDARHPAVGRELFVYDADTGTTALVEDLRPGSQDASPYTPVVYGGKLHVFASEGASTGLYAYDAATGAFDLAADASPCNTIPRQLAVYDGALYFCGDEGGFGEELWRYEAQQALALTLVPLDPPVVVGPGGGLFRFQVSVTNVSDEPQTFDGWTEAGLPGGGIVGALFGPRSFTLAAGATLGPITLEQAVPASAPPGSYVYRAALGEFPGALRASAEFAVEKTAGLAASGSEAGAGWVVTEIEAPAPALAAAVAQLALDGAAPNPFAGGTTVRFEVPVAGEVTLDVLDVLGRRVGVLHEGPVEAGRHAVRWEARGLPGGTYLVRLRMEGTTAMRRVTLLR